MTGASWSPPSPPSLSWASPLRLKRRSGSWAVKLGQRCHPSQIQHLRSSAIWDFLQMEDQMGTWEATQAFSKELEMHGIELSHDILGCQACSLIGHHIYCPHSRHHPDHPVHVCPWVVLEPNGSNTIPDISCPDPSLSSPINSCQLPSSPVESCQLPPTPGNSRRSFIHFFVISWTHIM